MPLVFVRPNGVETGRANVIAFAPAGTSFQFDLANTGLPVGHQYSIRSAFNWGNIVGSDTPVYNGGSQMVTISTSTTFATLVVQPLSSSYTIPTTSPLFWAFVVQDGGLPA